MWRKEDVSKNFYYKKESEVTLARLSRHFVEYFAFAFKITDNPKETGKKNATCEIYSVKILQL